MFARGDFADPSIHGGDMPRLTKMHAGAKRIRVRYAEMRNGATITYATADPALVPRFTRGFTRGWPITANTQR